MKRHHDETEAAIYRRKPTAAEQVEGLGLFNDAPTAVHIKGAGQLAREEARAKTNAENDRAIILETLRQHPDGLTRTELEDITSIPRNTVNARVAELCEAERWAPEPTPCYTEGHRTRTVEERGRLRQMKESVVHARAGHFRA